MASTKFQSLTKLKSANIQRFTDLINKFDDSIPIGFNDCVKSTTILLATIALVPEEERIPRFTDEILKLTRGMAKDFLT